MPSQLLRRLIPRLLNLGQGHFVFIPPVFHSGDYLLALAVAGRPLSDGHGFPVRLVAPDRRGVEWVKWIARIEVNETSHLWQPPLPLQ